MRIKNISILIFSLYLSACCTNSSSCILVKFWDGHYSMKSSSKEFRKKEKAFYESESQETKLLRVQNEQACDKLTTPLFHKKRDKYGNIYPVNMNDIFVHCMRVNGTPLYKDMPRKYDWLSDDDVRIKK